MRVETLKSLIGAKLLNSPAITSTQNFTHEAKRVKRGDLFFAYDPLQIPLAVQNGAYAVVFEGIVEILDPEIAWLKVQNLKEATIKLLRYILEYKPQKIYLVGSDEFEMMQTITTDKDVVFLQDSYESLFQLFYKEKKLFFSDNLEFVKSFSKEFTPLFSKEDFTYEVVKSSLFESSFIYKEQFYKNIQIPPFYIDKLLQALSLLQKLELEFNLQKFSFCSFFYPQFFNAKLEQKEFGKGSKVVIFAHQGDKIQHYIQNNLEHLKVFLYEEEDIDKVYTLLQDVDYLILTKLKKAVLQMPPFYKEKTPASLF